MSADEKFVGLLMCNHQWNVSKVLMFYMGFIKLVKYRMSIIFMTPNVKEDIVMSPWQKWHKISKWRKLCGCWEYIPSHIMTPRNGFLSQGHKDHPKVCMDTTACQRNKTCSADTMDCKDCMGRQQKRVISTLLRNNLSQIDLWTATEVFYYEVVNSLSTVSTNWKGSLDKHVVAHWGDLHGMVLRADQDEAEPMREWGYLTNENETYPWDR